MSSNPSDKRTCVFCGRSDGPFHKEDVLPKWIVKSLDVARVRIHNTTPEPFIVSKSMGVVTRAPCQRCNNGWMSDLEQAVRPFLEPMIHGQPVDLDSDAQTAVAQWFLKTFIRAVDAGTKCAHPPYGAFRMPNTFRLLLVLLLLGIVPGAASAQKNAATCPGQAPRTLDIARRLASSAYTAATRAKYQLPTLTETQVRLLSVPQGDGTICGKLTTLVQNEENGALTNPTMRLSYFTGGGSYYYIVAVRASTVDSPSVKPVSTGHQVLWVVNASGKAKVVAKIGV